jgi:endonuclease YncB( thermonuclease family)
MTRRLLVPVLLLVLALAAGRVAASTIFGSGASGDPREGEVERVVDGDTIRVDLRATTARSA